MNAIDLEQAHKHCIFNEDEVLESLSCGCFYCGHIFTPAQIKYFSDEKNNMKRTALCPRCEVDSVIGDKSGFKITAEFLKEMNAHWFNKIK